ARGIKDPKVLAAIRSLPRELFVPAELQAAAYSDSALPVACGQTISQPYIVAFMTEKLELKATDRVLEIGTGSGFQTGVLARLVQEVYTVEVHKELSEKARKTLNTLAIVITAANEKVPPRLLHQLKAGGRLILPLKTKRDEYLYLGKKNPNNELEYTRLCAREGVSNEKIQEIIKTAFRNSYCRGENKEAELHFEFNHDLIVYRLYQIVDKVTNPHREIAPESPLLEEGKVRDNLLFYPVDTKTFSFALSKKIKEHLVWDLEKIQKEKELRKMLELEVPEIKAQAIVIRDILIFPNFLNKVIVESKNPYLNAVGTCIGKDSSRLRSILKTIFPERIEIVK
ncbi:26082_t:CDS:2, partial [Racocetra persica]